MPYVCPVCDKQFTFQQSYHKHLIYHNDEKPYSCKECGRTFKELSTLYNHQRIHSGEKPYSCDVCGWLINFLIYWNNLKNLQLAAKALAWGDSFLEAGTKVLGRNPMCYWKTYFPGVFYFLAESRILCGRN